MFIVGSATGKDGIHGAAFASKNISDSSVDDLPAVQVGDPFQEKLLLEASLEVIASGSVIGIQDMGAAGIICSTSEMSAKGEHGMDIWLDRVPLRQPNMLPFEILLSESQERMLVVVKKGREEEILAIFAKWDLSCAQIGEVTDTQRLRFFQHDELVADVPAYDLVLGGGAPVYQRNYQEPAYYQKFKQFSIDSIPEPTDYGEVARFLLGHPNLASRSWVAEQYDSTIGASTITTNAPADAAVVRIKGTDKAITITVDCNGRYVHADPRQGCAIAVAESARNVICAGGEPVAVTNCLNFGNPYNPEVYWQFVEAIQGMKEACEALGTPVTGGNVSFYNQSDDGGAVFPTPVIGMLGLLADYRHKMTLSFKNEGDLIYLLGKSVNDIASSEYLYSYHQKKSSPTPYFVLEEELRLQQTTKDLIRQQWIRMAHDVSDGGLLVALAESAMAGNIGFTIESPTHIRKDAFLFGEAQSRIVVSLKPEHRPEVEQHLTAANVPYLLLGNVASDAFIVDGVELMSLNEARTLHQGTLGHYLS